jgi:ATP-dependent Clp protease ATP-binding subunit ClpC
MSTLNPNLLSRGMTEAMNAAAPVMRALTKRLLTPEVLLLTFIRLPGCTAGQLLKRTADARGFKLADLEREVENQARSLAGRPADFDFVASSGDKVPLSSEMIVVLDEGKSIAQAADEVWIGTEHALGAMSQVGVSTSGLLQRYGITPTAMTGILADQALAKRTTTEDWVTQARQGQLTPVYYRQALLRDLMSLLTLAENRHVILAGPAGVGKRTLVYSLALLVAEGKGPDGVKSVVEISERALLDNAPQAVQAGLRQAAGGVLFVPNLQRFFGGFKAEFAQAEKAMQKAFLEDGTMPEAAGHTSVVGTTTEADYAERIANVSAVAEHAHVLRVPPSTLDETVEILKTTRSRFESDYKLKVESDALQVAASLAGRYLTTLPLPGGAMQLLHRACALVRMSEQTGLPFRPDAPPDAQLDADDVRLAVSLMTGVPVAKLGADERSKYAQMVEHIKARIAGQDEAVLAVSRAVKTARVGLKDPKRPVGSFLFLGPTGVGKTELAKALADFMFGSEDALIALDMTEYQQEDSLNRLIGAAPGYVGFEGGGQLTDRVRTAPYTVVLFDECEKAHPRILDVLLQIMEEGRLTDGQGRTASFAEAVVILTSNLGSEFLADLSLGDEAKELAMQVVKKSFRPEFLNRLDEIVMFNALSPQALRLVLDLMLKKEAKLADSRGLKLEVSEAARVWLLAQNDHPEWGARPLRRIIERHVRQPLADALLAADVKPGTVVKVEAGEKGLTVMTKGTTTN